MGGGLGGRNYYKSNYYTKPHAWKIPASFEEALNMADESIFPSDNYVS